jgi:hypothetical protein
VIKALRVAASVLSRTRGRHITPQGSANSNWLTFPYYNLVTKGAGVFGVDRCPYLQILSMKLSHRGSHEARLRRRHSGGWLQRKSHNAATLARKQHILTRVGERQEEQLAIHQQATAQAAAIAQVTIESLIAEAEAARAKAMEEKGGAAAAVSALIAKAKLARMWREKIDQHNTGTVSTVWNVSWDEEGEQSDGREAG